MRYVTIYLRSL